MRTTKPRILIVEDDSSVTQALRNGLTASGFAIQVASDGPGALSMVRKWSPDLALVNVDMPKSNGTRLYQRIREGTQSPIIVLTLRGDSEARHEALENGANDYIAKPFSIDDLISRIRANLWPAAKILDPPLQQVIEAGDFRIDLETRAVQVGGKTVRLTPKEFDLLVFMARHPGKVLPHRVLLNAVWCGRGLGEHDDLRVCVNTLRRKIEPDKIPRYILTQPWMGYCFQPGRAQ